MSFPTRFRRALSAGVLLAAALAVGAPPVPDAEGPRVVDEAKVLKTDERQQLAAAVDQVQQQANCRLRVLLIASLDGAPIETYAREVAGKWWAGRADAGRGVLLVLAVRDRRSRLEVGSDLERKLTPGCCQRILDNMVEPLRANRPAAALTQAVAAVGTALQGTAAPPDRTATGRLRGFWNSCSDREKVLIVVLAVVLVVLVLGWLNRQTNEGYYCDRSGWYCHHDRYYCSSSSSGSSGGGSSGGGFRGGGASGSW